MTGNSFFGLVGVSLLQLLILRLLLYKRLFELDFVVLVNGLLLVTLSDKVEDGKYEFDFHHGFGVSELEYKPQEVDKQIKPQNRY